MANNPPESTSSKSQALLSPSPDKQPAASLRVTTRLLSNSIDDEQATKIYSTDSLKTFMSFYCDRHSLDLAAAIKSSIELFSYCIPSRDTVLAFYSELFDEYSTYYWITKKRSIGPASEASKGRLEYVGEFTRRFFEVAKLSMADAREDQMSELDSVSVSARIRSSPPKSSSSAAGPASPTSSQTCQSPTTPKTIPIAPKVIPVSRRTSSCNSTDIDQTPMSPSAHDNEESLDSEMQFESEVNAVDIFSEIENLVATDIRSLFERLVQKYGLDDHSAEPTADIPERQRSRLRQSMTNWAAQLLTQLNLKHSESAVQVANHLSKGNPSTLLQTEIDLWLESPVNKLLVDILLESHAKISLLFDNLMKSTQSSDWLVAYILLEISRRPNRDKDFSSCMEYIIRNQSAIKSVTHILAYLSDSNPKAMANFPKNNVPFLISLCQTSTSLLNVLSQEIPDTIDPQFLNNLAKEMNSRVDDSNRPPWLASLTHCIMGAPNSYKLYLLALEVRLNDQVSAEVQSAAQFVIDSISIKVQERAIASVTPPQTLLNQPVYIIDGLLEQIKNDMSVLVKRSLASKLIETKAREILYRMSLIYGHTFASKVIAHYLNLPEESFWPRLRPLLTKFMKFFGDDGSTLVSQTLSLEPELRDSIFWNNINSLTVLLPEMKINLEYISQLLIDKLCAVKLDMVSVAQLMKMCCTSLERVDHSRIAIGIKHKLCTALANCFFLLLEYESDDFPETLSYIRISLTCMSSLKQTPVASHVLCRALLERSIVHGHLFNERTNHDNEVSYTSLTKENLKLSLGKRFRRLPNQNENPLASKKQLQATAPREDIPNRQSINSYLLIEAFKSSINNIEDFANLFVEFHCPVMFDKHVWPSDEALRVINEKNLSILRKFEQIPPLWDLYELIGQNGCLKSCLVLVKALLAAHLALWASATTNASTDKMISTSRLIPPLAKSGLVPKAFGLTVEVFPHLAPSEVFSVLSDIWQYLKDTNSNGASEVELTLEDKMARAKLYLNRLRIFMCQHIPGTLYVKIFKEFYEPVACN